MKGLTVFAFLFILLLQCSMKMIIVIRFQLNREYISARLCENKNRPDLECRGKCYLKKELQKEEAGQLPAWLKEKPEEVFLKESNLISFEVLEEPSGHSLIYQIHYCSSCLIYIFHPPRLMI